MTKAIIFDIDSCLAAADEVGGGLFAPAFAAIRAASDGSVPEEKLQAAFAECWRVAFDAVADKYGNDAARRLAGVPADGRHRADVPVAERLREGSRRSALPVAQKGRGENCPAP